MDFDNIEGIKPNPNARKKRQSLSASPKKNQNGYGQRAASNSAGRKPGFKIATPSMDLMNDIYADESPTRNSQEQAQGKIKRKRQQQKNQLAESQKQNGWINDDEDDEFDNSSTQGCFDGVPTDKVYDSKLQKRMKQLKDMFGEDDDSYTKAVEKSKNHRGNKHGESSLEAQLLSPSNNSRRKRIYGPRARREREGRIFNQSSDPLDVAVSQQSARRGISSNDMNVPKLKNVKGRRKKRQVSITSTQQKPWGVQRWGGNTTVRETRDSSTYSGEKKKRSDSAINVNDDDGITSAIAAASNQPQRVTGRVGNKTRKKQRANPGGKRKVDKQDEIMGTLDSVNVAWLHNYEATQEAVRIAIGRKVMRAKCSLSFCFALQDQFILFSFEEEGGRMCEMRVYLKHHDLKEMKFHIANDDEYVEGGYIGSPMSVIAFRITPTTLNGLDRFADFYDKEETDESNDKGGRYITLEFQDTGDFRVSSNIRRMHCYNSM